MQHLTVSVALQRSTESVNDIDFDLLIGALALLFCVVKHCPSMHFHPQF